MECALVPKPLCGWAIIGTVAVTAGLAIFGGGVGGFLFFKTIGTAGVIAGCGGDY